MVYQILAEIQVASFDGTNWYVSSVCEINRVAYQNASRKEKLRNEISQEKRENAAFVQNSERSKMIENIQRKKQAKEGDGSEKKEVTKIRRQFTQKVVVSGTKPGKRGSVLDKVFE